MELVLTLPILMCVLMALFEFSLLFFARGTVVDAARSGARMACLSGATPGSVETEVRKCLGGRLGKNAEVDVYMGPHSGDPVAVMVSVPMKNASPDMLWPIGYRLAGRYLCAETKMIRE